MSDAIKHECGLAFIRLRKPLHHYHQKYGSAHYGINKLRFPSPVPVGSRVRLGTELARLEDVPGGVQAALALTFEVEGAVKPACVAEVLFRYYES